MTNATNWEPGTAYAYGDVVAYNGQFYKIIQPHRSQGDWAPDVVPALWGRIPDGSGYQVQEGGQTQGQQILGNQASAQKPWQQPGGTGHDEKHDSDSDSDAEGKGKESGDGEQGWLTEKRKNALMIAGGIAGVTAIGAGVFAYSKHKSKKEERAKQEAWRDTANADTWQAGAVARSEAAQNTRDKPPVYWIFTQGQEIPRNAIYGGKESSGQTLYIARSFHEGGLHPGKAADHLQGGASFSWGGREMTADKHEILVGDENAVEWITNTGRAEEARAIKEGRIPVEGGREKDGTFLFVARVKHEGAIIPAKIHEDSEYACFGYGGEEKQAREYQILYHRR